MDPFDNFPPGVSKIQDLYTVFGTTIALIDRTHADTDSGPAAYALDELISAVETHGGIINAVNY